MAPRSGSARFLLGIGVSMYGNWFSTVALVVILYGLTGNAAAPAGYMLARVTPRLIGPVLGGHLADRWSAINTLAAATSVQGLLTATMLAALEFDAVWWVYVAVALSQLAGSMARPTHGAIMPRIVDAQHIKRINAIYNMLVGSSLFVAPGLAALVLATVGPRLLLALDALSFGVCAVLVSTIRVRVASAARTARPPRAFAVVWGDRPLRVLAAAYFAGTLVVTSLQAVLVVAAARQFGGADAVTFLYSCVGIGGLVASVLILVRPGLSLGAAGTAVASLLEVLCVGLFSVPTEVVEAGALLAASSFFGAFYQTIGGAEMQRRVPTHLLGRVGGVVTLAFSAGAFMGALASLFLAPLVSWQATVAITGITAGGIIAIAFAIPIEGGLAQETVAGA